MFKVDTALNFKEQIVNTASTNIADPNPNIAMPTGSQFKLFWTVNCFTSFLEHSEIGSIAELGTRDNCRNNMTVSAELGTRDSCRNNMTVSAELGTCDNCCNNMTV